MPKKRIPASGLFDPHVQRDGFVRPQRDARSHRPQLAQLPVVLPSFGHRIVHGHNQIVAGWQPRNREQTIGGGAGQARAMRRPDRLLCGHHNEGGARGGLIPRVSDGASELRRQIRQCDGYVRQVAV